MAFLSRVGNVLRQTSKQMSSENLSRPSIYQAIRCMSSKLFVGGISYATDETSLREAFGKYGDVIEARIILDRETGRSRGFGFITFQDSEAASSAIQALDGQELQGRRIRVNFATDRARPNFGGGGGGGYGGNYGGGGGYGGNYGPGGGGGYGQGGGGGYGGNYGPGGGGGYGQGGGGGYGGNSGSVGGYSNTYGGENASYAGGNTFHSGLGADLGNTGGDYGVAGGGGGSSNVGGFDGSTEFGFDNANKFGSSESSNTNVSDGEFGQDPLDSNLRDEDDDDLAKRA